MSLEIRSLRAGDVPAIEKLLRANSPVFSDLEVLTAVEMLATGLDPVAQSSPDAYRFLVADRDAEVVGYALFARTPLTHGTWDLYWIAVDPHGHGKGVGQALLKAVEDRVKADGGRLLVLETSSRPDYAKARRFYEKASYTRVATIADFYKDGDDKVIFARRLDR